MVLRSEVSTGSRLGNMRAELLHFHAPEPNAACGRMVRSSDVPIDLLAASCAVRAESPASAPPYYVLGLGKLRVLGRKSGRQDMNHLRPNRRKGKRPDKAYLAFIAAQPCIVCLTKAVVANEPMRQKTRTEVAHVGIRGLMQKCSDLETIPLCAECHRTGPHAQHVLGRHFWTHHGLDKWALIDGFRRQFEKRMAA